jgi:hypothetical protein
LLDPPSSEVEQRAKVTDEMEAARAEARGQLALARGKMRKAAIEFREVAAYRTGQLKALLARRGQMCNWEALEDAVGRLAIAFVGLAEAEGDLKSLAEHLPDVVRYHERRIAFLSRLIQACAIAPEEARGTIPELNEALRAARARLKEVQEEIKSQKTAGGHPPPGSAR